MTVARSVRSSRALATIDGAASTATTCPRGSRSSSMRGDAAAAAARVEHALAALQRQPVEDRARHLLLRRRDPVVGGAVPVPRLRGHNDPLAG